MDDKKDQLLAVLLYSGLKDVAVKFVVKLP